MGRDDHVPTAAARERERSLVAAAREQASRVRARADAAIDDGGSACAWHDRLAEVGQHLPGYELEREIHRGGQGVVYQAVQRSTRRRVAIKVMKDGPFAGVEDKARFDREVRILAQLEHPSIVAIHDSGTAGGCFYSVMNYIAGSALDVYMREADPDAAATLQLFATLCDAVSVAHLRGIVHRDLKPSNVRVDAEGRPYVLDFGLARVEDGSAASGMTSVPAMTRTGEFVGSLPWASPEQARSTSVEIDVRSDVYSLGIILYQMLTGTFPYAVSGSMFEVADRIIHAEPMRPGAFGRFRIDSDVETMVLKCLSKERERRYQNAGELRRDIGRYLAGEPIEARRDSLVYVMRKALRRNRGLAIAGVLLVVMLVTGAAASAVSWRRAEREARAARSEAARAAQINTFLKELLTLADPARTKGQRLTVREALDAAAMRIRDGSLRDQPVVEADVLATIGAAYLSLSMYDEAEAQLLAAEAILARELGDDHADVLRTRSQLVEVYRWHGDHAAAVELARPTLERQRRILGEDDPGTLRTLSLLGAALVLGEDCREAEPCLRGALAGQIRVLGGDHRDCTESMTELANLLVRTDRLVESEAMERAAIEIMSRTLAPEDPKTLSSRRRLGGTLGKLGQLVEAEAWLRGALEGMRSTFGDEHASTANCKCNLGTTLREAGNHEEAGPLIREAYETYRRLYGPGNKWTIALQNGYGTDLVAQGRHAEAVEVQRDALAQARRVLGDEDFETLYAASYLAQALASAGQAAEAEAIARAAFETVRRSFAGETEMRGVFALLLAGLLEQRGAYDEAHALHAVNMEACSRAFGSGDARTLSAMDSLGWFLFARGRREEAAILCGAAVRGLCALEALDPARLVRAMEHFVGISEHPAQVEEISGAGVRRARALLPAGHWSIGAMLMHHAGALAAMDRFAEAEPELIEAQKALQAARGPRDARSRAAIRALVDFYNDWHAAEPGEGHDATAREWAEKFGATE